MMRSGDCTAAARDRRGHVTRAQNARTRQRPLRTPLSLFHHHLHAHTRWAAASRENTRRRNARVRKIGKRGRRRSARYSCRVSHARSAVRRLLDPRPPPHPLESRRWHPLTSRTTKSSEKEADLDSDHHHPQAALPTATNCQYPHHPHPSAGALARYQASMTRRSASGTASSGRPSLRWERTAVNASEYHLMAHIVPSGRIYSLVDTSQYLCKH